MQEITMIKPRGSFSLRSYSKVCAAFLSATLLALTLPLLTSTAGATANWVAVVDSGLNDPYQVAFNNGNMYIAGGDSNKVQEVTAAQLAGAAPYTPSTVASGAWRVTTLAFDSAGNLWFGDQSSGEVLEITAAQLAGTLPVTPTQAFVVPSSDANSIAFDGSGNLFIADDASEIFEVTASQLHAATPVVTTVANFSTIQPVSLVFDSGNLWVSDANGGVDEILASQLGGALITTATNIVSGTNAPSPWGLLFDPQGDLYFVDQTGFVGEVTASQLQSGSAPYTPTTLASGFETPIDITFSPNGTLFLADYGMSTIDELDYVVPEPPSAPTLTPVTGLSVSETSGSISGEWYPNATATSYTCTLMYGFNDPSTFSETSASTSCNFAVNSDASWGISVVANNSSGSSSPVVAFGAAVVAPPIKKVKKVTSIACTNGKHSKRVYGSPPTCPNGWRRK
jgi:sugar lactone lactonase YvrE